MEFFIKSHKHRPGVFTKLLASTVYNPTIKVDRTWTRIGNYQLPELIEAVNRCIDSDDDILTQFVEAPRLKARVNECHSFEQLVKVLYDYVFKPNPQVIESP